MIGNSSSAVENFSTANISAIGGVKITKLPPGAALGADDLQTWSFRRAVGKSGVPLTKDQRLQQQKQKGNEVMNQYSNENRGVLFREESKDKETDRDYSGSISIEGVGDFWLSGWIKTSRTTGKEFLSLSIKAKQPKAAGTAAGGAGRAATVDDDDLPF